jgi:hypothetical protein
VSATAALWDKNVKHRTRRKLLNLSRQTWAVQSQIVLLEGLNYRHARWGANEAD